MKKNYHLIGIILFVGLALGAQAQDTAVVAGWNFTSKDDLTATEGIAANVGVAAVSVSMGTAISYTSSSSAIYCNGWHAEAGVEKYWLAGPVSFRHFDRDFTIEFNASGSATGPAQFFVEYKIGQTGEWVRVASYVNTSKHLLMGPFALPTQTFAGAEEVYFRWLVDSTTMSISDKEVEKSGMNRLGSIYIKGVAYPVTAAPKFSRAAGSFFAPFELSMTCTDSNAVIYYTLDGSQPDRANGIVYKEPLKIDSTITVKAMAAAQGVQPSEVVQATYEWKNPSVKLVNLAEGAIYASPIYLEIDIENFTLADEVGDGDGFLKLESPIMDKVAQTTGLDSTIGLTNPLFCDENGLALLSQFPIEVVPGTYTITASLVGMDSVELNPAVAQSVTVTIAEPEIRTSLLNDTLIISAPHQPTFIDITGVVLRDSIRVSCSDTLFQITQEPSIVSKGDALFILGPNEKNVLSVVYVGCKERALHAELTLVSGEITKTIVLCYDASTDTVVAPIYTMPSVKLYPNPTTSFVQIELGELDAQSVEVISLSGQVVYRATNQGNDFTIPFNDCSKGFYFVRMATSDNKMVVKKVLKM